MTRPSTAGSLPSLPTSTPSRADCVAFSRLKSAARHASEVAERAEQKARRLKVAADYASAAVASIELARKQTDDRFTEYSRTETMRRKMIQQRLAREGTEAKQARARRKPQPDIFVLPVQSMPWTPMIGVPSKQGKPVPYW